MEGTDNEDDRDEMMAQALVSVQERLPNINLDYAISQEVHNAARNGATKYLETKNNMPKSWMENPSNRLAIELRIQESFADGKEKLSDDEKIQTLVEELSGKTGISEDRLFDYIKYRILLNKGLKESIHSAYDATSYGAERNQLKEAVNKVLHTLTDREKRVIDLRFGLEDGHPQTLEDAGREFGVTKERIRQIEAKALRKLRHPTKSRVLRDYLDGLGHIKAIKYNPPLTNSQLESRWKVDIDPYSLERMFLTKERLKTLFASGIRRIGDFFSAAPQEISEGWTGDPEDLVKTVRFVLDYLRFGEDSNAESNLDLLFHLTNAVAYRDNVSSSGFSLGYRKDLYRKAYEDLWSFFCSKI